MGASQCSPPSLWPRSDSCGLCSHSTLASPSVSVSLFGELVLKNEKFGLFIGLASECGDDMCNMQLVSKVPASSCL